MKRSRVLVVTACLLLIMVWANTLLAEEEKKGTPSKAEVMQRTKKLQMPFIANEGQTDERVMFYAHTFGGTVFVTKDGEIVYALPHRIHEGTDAHAHNRPVNPHKSPMNTGEKERVTPPFAKENEGGLDMHHSSPAPDSSGQADPLYERKHGASDAKQEKEARGVVLKEEIIGGRIDKIKGERKAITTVNDLRGNDPSKRKANIPTYEVVTLGEVYDGIELKLKAYGNNVEKLFCVKPGASPDQIKISLSGIQPQENPPPTPASGGQPSVPLSEGDKGGGNGIHNSSCKEWTIANSSLEKEYSTKSPLENGARGLWVNEHGELVAETGLGPVKFTKPVAYQEVDGKRVEVSVEYSIQNPEDVGWVKPVLSFVEGRSAPNRNGLNQSNGLESRGKRQMSSGEKGMGRKGMFLSSNLKPPTSNPQSANSKRTRTNKFVHATHKRNQRSAIQSQKSTNPKSTIQNPQSVYGFKVASYDRTKELIIDPLLASTFLGGSGGSGEDYGYSIAVNASGNIYVTGYTLSGFPTTIDTYDTSYNGGGDAFVSKFNEDLTTLLASTLLGGSGKDSAHSLVIDSDGNVYVTGNTKSEDFPTTPDAYDTSYGGGTDAFVSKFNGDLTNLLASTYLGGASDDFGNSIAINSSGNVYVTGNTESEDFSTTDGAYDTSYGGGTDAFVSKFNGDLTNLIVSTYLGGASDDFGNSGAIDSSGNVYVTGNTKSEDFSTTDGAYDTSYGGGTDAFVSKFNGDLTNLIVSTYLGGASDDFGNSGAIDSSGNVYVSGWTLSEDFPTTPDAYDTSHNGEYIIYYGFSPFAEAFVSKLSANLTDLLASTYLGEDGHNFCYSIAIGKDENIYAVGYNYSYTYDDRGRDISSMDNNVFVKKLNRTLTSLLASIYLGGSVGYPDFMVSNYGYSLVIDPDENVYITGSTLLSDFPTTNSAYDTSYNGNGDAFVSRLNGNLTDIVASTYLGGSSDYQFYFTSISIDQNGNIYVTGHTASSDFPTTNSAYNTSYNGNGDAFVSRLNGDLTNLLASTYLGGASDDFGKSIAIDSSGNVYVAGSTHSSNFPTTAGAYDTSFGGNQDVFVSKLNVNLTSLVASTYLGDAYIFGMTIDKNDNIYVTGSAGLNFPITPGAYNTSGDSFVSRLSSDLTSLLASTYLLGYGTGAGKSVVVDAGGNIYVAMSHKVLKLNGDLTSLLASTYLGGSGHDYSHSIAIDTDGNIYVAEGDTVSKLNGDLTSVLGSSSLNGGSIRSIAIDKGGNVYVTGDTTSRDFSTTPDAYDTSFEGFGATDTFVSKFNGELTSLLASTYLGGSGQDYAHSIAIDTDGNIYISGVTGNITGIGVYGRSLDFPITPGAYDTSGYGDDIFISKFDSNLSASPVTVPYDSSSLTIDGNLSESAWDIATDVSNVVIGTANNTVKFGVLWDNTYLYVGMKVLDDTLYNDSTYVHEDDSVEIYIDGNHNHGTTYDNYDRQFVKGWFDSALVEQHGKTTGVLHGWAPISGGYSIELAIPWSNLGITPTAGMTLGFSVGYNDDDNGGDRDGQAIWRGTADNWMNTSALGDIVLGADPNLITVPYTSTNLTVDGNVSESAWNIATDVSKTVIGTVNNTTTFGVLWDNTYLYVGMKVLDDTLYNDSTFVHEDDSVEIYIDGDHNHGMIYDSYDRQFVKGWFDSILVEQHGKTTGVLHGWSPISGGYTIELAIPWSNLGITPTAGMTLGFSVGYNDDDNGAGRDGQAVWIGTANNYLDTSAFGGIILGAASPPTPTPTPTSTSTPPSPTPTPVYTPTNTPTPPPSPTPIVTPPLTPTPTPLPGSLNALYTFNEGSGAIVNDSSGNGNHGAINGATWATGISGGAVSLDGINDYVDLGNPANLQPGTVSLSVWFKTTATGGRIIRKRTYGYGLDVLPTGKISFWINNAAAARFTATSPNAYNDNAWHHAVGVYGGSLVKLYIDGLQVASANAGAIFYGGGAIAIGRDGDYNGSYFKGLIDDVRIFQSELSAQEVLALYNQASSGLVSHWKLDEGSGTHATDSAGGNDGTINGAMWTGCELSLDGVNDYVTKTSPSSSLKPSSQVAVSAWIKISATDTKSGEVVSMGDSYGLRVKTDGSVLFFYYDGSTWRGVSTTGVNAFDGKWHHIVGQKTSSALQVYVDGVLKGSFANAGIITYTLGTGFFIGKHGKGSTVYDFKGAIDDVRMYNKTLSDQEVRDLGFLAHYNLDEGSGTIAYDQSGNGNECTINGATWTGCELSFDGDDYITKTNPSSALKPLSQIAISAQIKANTTDTNGGEVVSMGDSYGLRIKTDGTILFFYYDGTTWRGVTTTGVNVLDGIWHHIVGQKTGSVLQIYVDGVLKGSLNNTGTIAYTLGAGFFIGKHGMGNTLYDFKGTIDDVRVYGRTLSVQEVQELYNTFASSGIMALVSRNHGDNNINFIPKVAVTPMHPAITLRSFKAGADDGRVTLTWETSGETDNAGFNIYRARRRNGRYVKVNDTLINAKISPTSGASYDFIDTPQRRNTYYYKLETVGYDGVSTMHGYVKVRVRR